MNTAFRSLLCAAVLLCAAALPPALPPAQAAGSVEVQWLEPARYSDAGRSSIERERVTRILGDHLEKLGRLLPDGQVLKLQVTDIDLAGEIEPFGWHNLRVLRGRADWPHMSLRFTLTAEGRTLKSGDARLSDLSYQFGNAVGTQQGDLSYEKRMVEQWFKAEFSTRP